MIKHGPFNAHPSIMDALIKRLATSCDEDTDLHQAAYVGDVKELTRFLQRASAKTQINQRNRLGCTPLRLAASSGHTGCVQLLLSYNADVEVSDIKAQTPVATAVKNKHLGCVRLLLEAGANPDGDRQNLSSPLYLAAMMGDLAIVQALVSAGADVNGGCERLGLHFTSSPLYITMAYQHWQCFRCLLLAGADADMHCLITAKVSGHGESLYHAALAHNTPVAYVELLYECGAMLYKTDKSGRMPWQIENNSESRAYLEMQSYKVRPLRSFCRLSIRRTLGQKGMKHLKDLPLPPQILQYLSHEL